MTFQEEMESLKNAEEYEDIEMFFRLKFPLIQEFHPDVVPTPLYRDDWGCHMAYYIPGHGMHVGFFIKNSLRGSANYERIYKEHFSPMPVLTFPDCQLEKFLIRKKIPHMVLR